MSQGYAPALPAGTLIPMGDWCGPLPQPYDCRETGCVVRVTTPVYRGLLYRDTDASCGGYCYPLTLASQWVTRSRGHIPS